MIDTFVVGAEGTLMRGVAADVSQMAETIGSRDAAPARLRWRRT